MTTLDPFYNPDAVPSLTDQPDPNGVYRASNVTPTVARFEWIPDTAGADPAQPVRDQPHVSGSWWVGGGLYATWHPTQIDSAPEHDPDSPLT